MKRQKPKAKWEIKVYFYDYDMWKRNMVKLVMTQKNSAWFR